ncbi:MAG: nucleotide exchange factor GrpE [Treponema sp.]|jgi:molecular chaperone GrpE|nr:nucleotide exchange factor GrpE [Treponema sp.]
MSKHSSQRNDPSLENARFQDEGGKNEGEGIPSPSEKETNPSGQGSDSCKACESSSGGELKEKTAALEAQLKEANDQFLRKAADFENFRKRMNREKQDAIDFANQSLLLDLIPVLDDFERALKAAEGAASPSQEFTALYEGISMIEKRFSSQMENKWGLKRFDSLGEPFDPNRHEALMMEKSPEAAEPVVQEEFLKGYILKDRVIRSAKVKVLMPESSQGAAPSDAPQDSGAAQEGPQDNGASAS